MAMPYKYAFNRIMGELMVVVRGQYARVFGGCSEEREKITGIMEEVVSVHSLLSRTVMEISSPLVLALTISFVYNTL